MGGAASPDRRLRVRGVDWWEDEECSVAELSAVVGRYAAAKPRIMVTHDAPSAAVEAVFPEARLFRPLSRTVQAFDAMLGFHRPDLWIFGHWHRSAGAAADGTRFQCLGERRHCSLIRRGGRTPTLHGGSERI